MLDRTIDYVIIAPCLIGAASFGIVSGVKQKKIFDYFLGVKIIPRRILCFLIAAAGTGTLALISIAYLSNLNFLQLTFGYLTGRILTAVFLSLPDTCQLIVQRLLVTGNLKIIF